MGKKKLKNVEFDQLKSHQNVSSRSKNEPDLYSQIFAEDSDEAPCSTNEIKTQKGTERMAKSSPLKSCHKAPVFKGKEKREKKSSTKRTEKALNKIERRMPVSSIVQAQRIDESSESEDGDYDFDDDNEEEEEVERSMDADATDDEEGKDEEQSEDSEDDDDESEVDDDNVPRTVLRKQLKDLSFEELESLKQKMGLKEYNEAMFATKGKTVSRNKKRRKFERTNKNRPREISSKMRVPKLRQVVKVKKKIVKDPRFDSSSGEYNEKFWNSEYSFIRDIQKKEAEEMKTTIKSVGDKSKKKEMRSFIQRVSDKEKSIEAKQNEEKKRVQDKEENKKRVQEGKRPFFMKKSTKKLVELVEKYDELKASGKLEKYLKKKRKKNAFRDKKTLNG